ATKRIGRVRRWPGDKRGCASLSLWGTFVTCPGTGHVTNVPHGLSRIRVLLLEVLWHVRILDLPPVGLSCVGPAPGTPFSPTRPSAAVAPPPGSPGRPYPAGDRPPGGRRPHRHRRGHGRADGAFLRRGGRPRGPGRLSVHRGLQHRRQRRGQRR